MRISEPTFYNGKKKYVGLGVSERRQLRQLEEENGQLKWLVADLSLDKHILQEVLAKKSKAQRQVRLGGKIMGLFDLKAARTCGLVRLQRSSWVLPKPGAGPKRAGAAVVGTGGGAHPVRLPAVDSAAEAGGMEVNAKRVYRHYRREDLAVQTKGRKKRASQARVPTEKATRINQRWSMNFITDRLEDWRYFRVLTLLDQFSRECLRLEADFRCQARKWRRPWRSGPESAMAGKHHGG